MIDETTVAIAPHNFMPVHRWDRRRGGHCELCYLPHRLHPTDDWVERRVQGVHKPHQMTTWFLLAGFAWVMAFTVVLVLVFIRVVTVG